MGIKDTTIFKRLRQFMNPAVKGKMIDGVLSGFASGDQSNANNVILMKDQLFIASATHRYLQNLLSGIGVIKPVNVGIDDDSFRELAIKQTNTKLVTNVFLDVLETFYGADAVKASAISTKTEGYKLEDGMTLIILADKQTKPLTITFTAKDFTNIAHATADEICAVISRFAFNAAYPIVAITEVDKVLDLRYVKVRSLTKGPNSAITIVGGSAQNVLQFLAPSPAQSKDGTEYAVSFVGQYVRFTWVAGPDPALQFLNAGDTVNIYGPSVLEINRGTFTVENAQGGAVNDSFFEILNPIFKAQANVICNPADSVSGDGQVKATADILTSPTGLIRSANVVTVYTATPHNFAIGNMVNIKDSDNTTFFGTFPITSVLPTSFTFNQIGIDAISGGGTAEVTFIISAEPVGAIRLNSLTTITTTTNHSFVIGQQVSVSKVRDSSFDGLVTVTGVTANTFNYIQDSSNEITFFQTKRNTLQSLDRYATVYEANPYEITIFLPVTTRIVKRGLIGAWHLHSSSTDRSFPGSYIFSPKSGLSITRTGTKLNEPLTAGTVKTVVAMQNTTQFPDAEGFLMLNWGEENQEGPIRYFGRPSSGSLLVDPSYKFKQDHANGSSVYIIKDTHPVIPRPDGTSRQAFLTGSASGRLEAESLIEKLKASGIFLNIILVVPEGPGLHDMRYVYDIGDNENIY
jgi:hypothetical protein